MEISLTQTITALVAFFLGWKARGYLDVILTRLFIQIYTSAFGKRVVLETLIKGLKKLDGDPTQ